MTGVTPAHQGGKSAALGSRAGQCGNSHDSGHRTAYFYLQKDAFYQGGTMGAQLNIKSEIAYHIASELSELTGESLTAVVTRALRAELDRHRRERDIDAKVARMLAAGKEIRAHLREPVTSDHSCLYDENGFPK